MRAVVYETFGATPTIATLPDPTPTADGVVVKVEATGLCRSDWHGWMGHDPDIVLPHVPGHELAGRIVAIGRDVKRWNIGDRVTVPFVSGCGHCGECASGHQHICDHQMQPGFTCWGSFAEYVALSYADLNVVRLPDTMEFATAASLGCRFVTSYSAVIDKGDCKPGEWVAVHGCGGVGLSAIMIASAMGAQVIAVDITADKLSFAKTLGATAVVNANEVQDISSAIRDITGGGAHLSIDALGHSETALNSVLSLRKRGRHVQVGLMLAAHARAAMPMDRVIAWELEIKGSHGMQAHRYGDMFKMIERGILRPELLIGKHIPLEDAPAALTAMDRFEGTGISVITNFGRK
jgi:alcohol dehydrogenase